MDKFESMKAFIQVVEAGGFAAAARRMGLSRSAVNKLVMNLEAELQTQLLHRTTRKVSPTDSGRAFHERCVAILADLAEAEQAIARLQGEPKGRLRINAPMTFGTRHLAPCIAEFLGLYEDLRLELLLDDRQVDPISEGFDLTIRIAQPPTDSALVVHELAAAKRVICASPQYLKQAGTPRHPKELKNHRCLHYGHLTADNHWLLSGAEANHPVRVRGPLCSNNGEVLRDAALNHLGITLLPKFIIKPDLQAGHLVPLLEEYSSPDISVCLIYPVNRHLSTKVMVLTDFLQSRLPQELN